MKKYSFLLLCLILSTVVMAQKAMISFEEKSFNFGKINEEDGKVNYIFHFTNKGVGPLVVNRVQASCGCTTPTWTKEPIEPGKKGSVMVTYNPLGRPGLFAKTITVYSNSSTDEQTVLTIKGDVIPKADENLAFPVNMNGLLLKSKVVQMNNIDKGRTQLRYLDIQNSNNFAVKPTIENLPPYLTVSVSPETLKPKEEGRITFTLDSKSCSQWGPISDDLFLTINGKKDYSEDFKVLLVGNIVEDFGKLTLDQKRKAPILEIQEKTLNLGVIRTNSKRSGKYKVKNIGINVLELRRLINNNKELTVRSKKTSVAGGKSTDIVVEVNTKNMAEGEYKKTFTIQTNDPENSFVLLVINWKIEK